MKFEETHDEAAFSSSPEDVPLLLTIHQTARTLCLSRAKIYKLIRAGDLPVVRIDRAIRVSQSSLQRWIAQKEACGELTSAPPHSMGPISSQNMTPSHVIKPFRS